MDNLIKPTAPASMADGWETRRRRVPGNDWVMLRLGKPGTVQCIEIDTSYFKGNNPARCAIRGALLDEEPPNPEDSACWPLLLPPVALGPDQLQWFQREVLDLGVVSHVRLDIYPDGGIARLRLYGEPEQ